MPAQSANQSEIITLFEWSGVNQSATRGLIGDQEVFWSENFWPIAPGHLRAGHGPSAPLYSAPSGVTILRIFFTNIDGTDPLGFMFRSDGVVDVVNLNTEAVHTLGQIWQPVAPHYWASLKLWQPSQFGNVAGQVGGVVIGSPQGLYAVDANFNVSAPGSAAPNWLTGGNAMTMPSGLPGIYALEVFMERLWVMGQTVISFSAPTNGADFSAAGGGGSFPYFGDQLTVSYTALKASGGFLYVFGDSCVQAIYSVTTASVGGEAVAVLSTQFINTNVDPQNGQRFFRPVGVYSVAMAVLNGSGIYLLTGQSPMALISDKITNLIHYFWTQPTEPTMTAADIFSQRWLLINGTFTDPYGVSRSMMLCYHPEAKAWTIASQNLNLTQIGAYEQNSCITPYGTDGNSLYKLFAQPDPNLPKRILTKAYKGPRLLTIKNWKRIFLELHDNTKGPEGVTVLARLHTNGGGIPNGAESIGFELPPGTWDTLGHPTAGAGLAAALDVESLSPDFVIERISFAYEDRTDFGA